jgi:hypothetical protein
MTELVLEPVYFVVQRDGEKWDTGIKILYAFAAAWQAEDQASHLKEKFPNNCYGVARLVCEVRAVVNPVVIVRASEP